MATPAGNNTAAPAQAAPAHDEIEPTSESRDGDEENTDDEKTDDENTDEEGTDEEGGVRGSRQVMVRGGACLLRNMHEYAWRRIISKLILLSDLRPRTS